MAPRHRYLFASLLSALIATLFALPALADDDDNEPGQSDNFSVTEAIWRADRSRLVVVGTRDEDASVEVVNAYDPTLAIGSDKRRDRTAWRVISRGPSPVPCRVIATSSRGGRIEIDVARAPADCGPKNPVEPPTNQAPVANAGPDQTLTLASGQGTIAVTLDGSGSSDPDGTVTGYDWTGSPDPANAVSPSVNLAAGTHTFTLVVTDDDGASSAPDTVRITVNPAPVVNKAPSANAGPDQTLTLATGQGSIAVTLNGSGSSDPDGTVTGYDWTGSPDPANTLSPSVNLAAGSYTFSLVVTDNDGASSAADTVSVTVNEAPSPLACDPMPADPKLVHQQCIQEYTGPEVCVACHESEARDMHGSVHYQQSGPTDYVTNINGPAGERWNGLPGDGFSGINTYCGTHENSPRFTCAGCHVGNGRFPKTPDAFAVLSDADQAKELANIDCLMCHQEQYKRFPDPAGQFVQLSIVAPDPVTGEPNPSLPPLVRTGLEGIPAVDPLTKDFRFVPADPTNPLLAGAPIPLMSISALEAARTVHATTRKSCLNCHAGAAGADGAKRGDLSSLLANPSIGIDMHMSSAGGGLKCADCHSEGDHRVVGRGVDLRPNDVPARLTCENSGCHSNRPHGDYSSYSGSSRDTHAGHIACQTCHIPVFGKGIATEMARDWEDPHYSAAACNGRGGWLPREDKASNVIPTYAWFNGTSEVSYLGEPLASLPKLTLADSEADAFGLPRGSDAYVLGLPLGNVADPSAKLQPMKEHLGKLARHLATDTLIGHSTFEFFRTGDFDAAVRSGMEQTQGMKASDDYEVVAVHTFQSVNHGVEVASKALQCGACHSGLSGGPARMNLKADLGYQLKGPTDQVCTQCHGNKGSMSFTKIHDKHVKDKRRDCSTCHKFSRPERGLSTRIGG